jgi:hypothetical protein
MCAFCGDISHLNYSNITTNIPVRESSRLWELLGINRTHFFEMQLENDKKNTQLKDSNHENVEKHIYDIEEEYSVEDVKIPIYDKTNWKSKRQNFSYDKTTQENVKLESQIKSMESQQEQLFDPGRLIPCAALGIWAHIKCILWSTGMSNEKYRRNTKEGKCRVLKKGDEGKIENEKKLNDRVAKAEHSIPHLFHSTENEELWFGFESVLKKAKSQTCVVCGIKGASVACKMKRCTKKYHLFCAVMNECFFQGRFSLFSFSSPLILCQLPILLPLVYCYHSYFIFLLSF